MQPVRVQARIAEIMRAGAERAEVTVEQVLRELAKIGFSDIRKAVAWRNEMVAREDEEERKGEDGVVRVTRVLLPRLSIVPSEEMDPDIAAAIGLGAGVRADPPFCGAPTGSRWKRPGAGRHVDVKLRYDVPRPQMNLSFLKI